MIGWRSTATSMIAVPTRWMRNPSTPQPAQSMFELSHGTADDSAMLQLALDQFREARNMTDTLAALSTLTQREDPQVDQA